MIAVRDLLLEDQMRYEHAGIENVVGRSVPEEEDVGKNKTPGFEDDEEEDFEFNDNMDADGMFVQKKRHRKSRKTRKYKLDAPTTPDEEGSEAEFNENADDAVHITLDSQNNDGHNETMSSEDEGETAKNVTSPSTEVAVANYESTEESPKLSGNKRILKSLRKMNDEDSDDEDFSGLAVPAKSSKRFILDDDEDD